MQFLFNYTAYTCMYMGMGLIISMCINPCSKYAVFMDFTSTVSGEKTRYMSGGRRKGRD